MNYYVSYSTQSAPLDHGVIIVDNSFVLLSAIGNFIVDLFKMSIFLAIITLGIYFIYKVVSKVVEKYKRIMFLLEDTNKKVTLIEEKLNGCYHKKNLTKSITAKDYIENHENNSNIDEEQSNVFIVDADGVITTKESNSNDKEDFIVELDSTR